MAETLQLCPSWTQWVCAKLLGWRRACLSSDIRTEQEGLEHKGPILLGSSIGQTTQLNPVQCGTYRVELGTHRMMKYREGHGSRSAPSSHMSCTAPGNGKQRAIDKLSRHHLGLKSLLFQQEFPNKKQYKKNRDESGRYKSVHR